MPRKLKRTADSNGSLTHTQTSVSAAKPKITRKKTASRETTIRVAKAKPSEVTDDAIRLRAYFISQDRRRHGLPSDPNLDWVEARRQLLREVASEKS